MIKTLYRNIFTVLLLTGTLNSYGQQILLIPHVSGTATIGGTSVTVSHTGTAFTGTPTCAGIGHYTLGGSDSVYLYEFAQPTTHVRFLFQTMASGEVVSFFVNGKAYILTAANISAQPNSCNCNLYAYAGSNGKLMTTSPGFPQLDCARVDIIDSNGIDSVRLHHNRYESGCIFSSYFLEDTTSFIPQPYTDTLFCPGDSLYLKYTVNHDFQQNNSFTAQLSSAAGSFSSPVNIGSLSYTKDSMIPCRIPPNTAAGSGYRIRIVGGNPKDTSYDNRVNIRVKAGPVNFTNTTQTPICAGDTLYITGTSTTSGLTWGWTGPGGFTASKEDTFIANTTTGQSGSYVLKASLPGTGCSLTDSVTVLIKPLPAKPNASSNNPVCETKTLQLITSSSTTGVSYSWTGPGSYSSSTQNPMVSSNATLAMSGNYISTVTLNGCERKDTVTVNVIAKPAKPTVAAPNSPLCARQDLLLTANSSTGGISYFWYGPAAYTANAQNPVRANAQLNHAGKYFAFVTSSGCASDTDSVTVVVNTDPVVNIFPTPGSTICQGSGAVFTAVPTNGGTPAYKWYINNSNTGATAVSYNSPALNNGDKVYCLMTSTGTCATPFTDTSNVITMNVLPPKAPMVSIVANINPPWNDNTIVTFTATVTNASSVAGLPPGYQWKKNGVNIGGAIGNYWAANTNSLSANDKVCVLVKSAYECPVPDTVLSNCINTQFTGVNDVTMSGVKVYPNPVTNVLRVEAPLRLSPKGRGLTVELYDVVGRKCDVEYRNDEIDMSALPSGNYVLQVTDANGERAYFKVTKK